MAAVDRKVKIGLQSVAGGVGGGSTGAGGDKSTLKGKGSHKVVSFRKTPMEIK